MPKVFISYKREEAKLASIAKAKLADLDVDFFIDEELTPDGSYSVSLDKQLAEAAAVFVLWTRQSAKSDFVYSEAQKGNKRGILVAALLDDVTFDDLRVPFNTFQASDLTGWLKAPRGDDPQWQNVLEALGTKLGRPGLAELAIVLESGSDEAKRAFLRDYPDDPVANRFASQFEATERAAFSARMKAARSRLKRRSIEAERRLKAYEAQFETVLGGLRAGKLFDPPDPMTAVDTDFAALHEQAEANLAKLQGEAEADRNAMLGLRKQVDEAQDAAKRANDEKAALEERIRAFGERPSAEDLEAATRANADLTNRQKQAARRSLWIACAAVLVALGSIVYASPLWPFPDDATAGLRSQIAQLQESVQAWTRREAELKSREAKLAAQPNTPPPSPRPDGKELKDAQTRVAQLEKDLAAAKAAAAQDLATERSKAAQRDKDLADARTQVSQLQAQVSQLQPPAATLASRCDDMTAYRFDADRPPGSKWKERETDISPINDALDVCAKALQAAQAANDAASRRRMALQLGRIHLAQASAHKTAGRPDDARRSSEQATKWWQSAIQQGSIHAYVALAAYYAEEQNCQLAWENYSTAAARGSAVGQTFAALYLIYPERYGNCRKQDHSAGRQYLDAALSSGYPRVFWAIGIARMDGRAEFERDVEEGVRYIGLANCLGDDPAARFFSSSTRHQAPTCAAAR